MYRAEILEELGERPGRVSRIGGQLGPCTTTRATNQPACQRLRTARQIVAGTRERPRGSCVIAYTAGCGAITSRDVALSYPPCGAALRGSLFNLPVSSKRL